MKQFCYFLLIMSLTPFLLANKGCDKETTPAHPPLEKGMACADCHDDGRSRDTKPADHTLAWEKVHGQWIRKEGFKSDSTCLICHTESTCSSCHQREKPQNHNQFWRLRGHGLAVGLARSRCFSCHRGADFCDRCHSETRPQDHLATWGAPSNQHCLSCHFPLSSVGGQKCAVCHGGTPSHTAAPAQPANALHVVGANCRSCHSPLRHPDNGMSCTTCHSR